MSLTKKTYVYGTTPVSSLNLNDIQDEIIRQGTDYVPKAGGTFTGNVALSKANLSTSVAQSLLTLGNNIPDGTTGSSYGGLQFYGDSDKWAYLRPATGLIANRTIILPDKSGTMAIAEDYTPTTYKVQASDCVNIKNTANITAYLITCGNICEVLLYSGVIPNTSGTGWTTLFNLPITMNWIQMGIIMNDTDDVVAEWRITTDGKFEIYSPIANKAYWGSLIFIKY